MSPYTIKQTHSQCVHSLLACARFCSIRSVAAAAFFYLAFYVLSFLIIIMVFPNVDTTYEFIPIKLFVLCCFYTLSFGILFGCVLFAFCFLSRCFILFIVTCFHWKWFLSCSSFYQIDIFLLHFTRGNNIKCQFSCYICYCRFNIIISLRFFFVEQCFIYCMVRIFLSIGFLVFEFMFYSPRSNRDLTCAYMCVFVTLCGLFSIFCGSHISVHFFLFSFHLTTKEEKYWSIFANV